MRDECNQQQCAQWQSCETVLETGYKTVPIRYVLHVQDVKSLNVIEVNNLEIGKESSDVASAAGDETMCNGCSRK